MQTDGTARIGTELVTAALCLLMVAVPIAPFPFVARIYEYTLIPKELALHLTLLVAVFGWLLQSDWGRNLNLSRGPAQLPLVCFPRPQIGRQIGLQSDIAPAQ